MNMQTIDPQRFRSVMGAFPTGVAVIATEWQGDLFGATINSLTSVSLQPCMLLFCANEGSATGAAIRKCGLFSVSILGQHQHDLSARFTGQHKSRFDDLVVAFTAEGLPLLEGAAAQLCCKVSGIHKAGDHEIILGEVLTGKEAACSPLVFHKGRYGGFSALEQLSKQRARLR